MSQRSASESNAHAPELNVSIVDRSRDTISASLERASDRLDSLLADGKMQRSDNDGAEIVLTLIERICLARNRRAAAAELTTAIAACCRDGRVRCGVGTDDQLRRLFDDRLGWLGPESSLHREYHQRWPRKLSLDAAGSAESNGKAEPPNDSPSGGELLPEFHPRDAGLEIRIPEPHGTGRLVVWIDGSVRAAERLGKIRTELSPIAAAIWSRPVVALPTWSSRLARRSKLTVAALIAVLGVILLWPVPYRIRCTARVDTTHQRIVSTPFEAMLQESHFDPGDAVAVGDVLVRLDGRPLRLEREQIDAERQQVAKEYQAALATGQIAEAQRAELKQRQLARRHELLSDRLARLDVVSPIDGVIVSGDLDRYTGAPLERGQTLMEVAPMDKMMIEVEIPGHEIGFVRPGTDTRIKIDAIGGKSIWQPLGDVLPRAEIRDNQNVFVARIPVSNRDWALKPGMQGDATTYGPLRPLIWSWVRTGIERVLWWIGY